MKNTALRFRTLAIGLALTGSIVASSKAVDAYTDPVGYYTLSIQGGTDNVMSLPMVRDAVFSGVVSGNITPTGFDALAGTAAPGWTANQFVYVPVTQTKTYYVEFTSGALRGLYYKIVGNGTGSVTLDTEGDSLLSHTFPGSPAPVSLAVGDSFKIRPFWTVKDLLETGGNPIIDPRTAPNDLKDEILIPNNAVVGINKAPEKVIYYLAGQGWRAEGAPADENYADFVLRPNEGLIVRRRNATSVNLTNLGGVLMNKQVSFVPGGGATTANDVFVSLNRPAAVSLNASGLETAMTASANRFKRQDLLLAFPAGAGFDRAPSEIYYVLAGQPAGQAWRKLGDDANTAIGQTAQLQPGQVYVIRKGINSAGKDWANDPNY